MEVRSAHPPPRPHISLQQLVADWKDEAFLSSGDLDLWGMNGPGDVCTANMWDGCRRIGDPVNIVNPVMSGRLRTLPSFAFKYGSSGYLFLIAPCQTQRRAIIL